MGMYRRKVHTGTIDGQGSLLVHPMTWLDERLFGWSRSARRGTSAWAGNPSMSSGAASRVASPDASDDEDHGDYDNVIGYLPSIVGDAVSGLGFSRSRTPKSLRGSFADLPSVRRAEENRDRSRLGSSTDLYLRTSRNSQPPSPLLSTRGLPDSPTSSVRAGGPRRRKMSLTDAVSVERIGKLDQHESFTEATEELNQENEEKRGKRGKRV